METANDERVVVFLSRKDIIKIAEVQKDLGMTRSAAIRFLVKNSLAEYTPKNSGESSSL